MWGWERQGWITRERKGFCKEARRSGDNCPRLLRWVGWEIGFRGKGTGRSRGRRAKVWVWQIGEPLNQDGSLFQSERPE
jgi:hypothetical protein